MVTSSRPFDYTWMPETVQEAIQVYPKASEYWQQFFQDFHEIKELLRWESDVEIPLKINHYLNTLITADKMMQHATFSISLLTENKADGLLSVLTKNLRQNAPITRTRGTNIRIISLNERFSNRLRNYRPLTKLTTAVPTSPQGINSFLICDDSYLEIKTPATQLRTAQSIQTLSDFYYAGYIPEAEKLRFDAMWYCLNPEDKPEKPKSKLARILEIVFE